LIHFYKSLKMMDAMQPKTPEAVLASLQQHGAAVGAKKMLVWEFKHAKQAISSKIYVTLYNMDKDYECTRLGKFSRCFCNHLYAKHNLKKLKNGRFGKNPCGEEGCKCENYLYMYRRPEEIGQYYLTRRKGFDVNDWRPLCKCRHPHANHSADKRKCTKCSCGKFVSDFLCLSCDGKWEEHEVRYDHEADRISDNKPVGQLYYPLHDVPEIQQEFLAQLAKEEEEEKRKKLEVEDQASSGQREEKGDQVVANIGQQIAQAADGLGRVELTLPAREKPERSVRLMRERGMLQKY